MRALILFGHGARDARWAEPFEKVRELLRREQPDLPVALAFLEMMEPNLEDALLSLRQQGCDEIVIVPLFLGQGGHLRRDVPELVAAMQQRYADVDLRVARAAGEDEGVLRALASYCMVQFGAD